MGDNLGGVAAAGVVATVAGFFVPKTLGASDALSFGIAAATVVIVAVYVLHRSA